MTSNTLAARRVCDHKQEVQRNDSDDIQHRVISLVIFMLYVYMTGPGDYNAAHRRVLCTYDVPCDVSTRGLVTSAMR